MTEILKKFGCPASLIGEFAYWYLLLRPQQVTFGAMVLIEKSFRLQLSEISQESFLELRDIIGAIEGMGKMVLGYDKVNYLMLMMVDPEVHYHVIPRYAGEVKFNGELFLDHGWPGLPDFSLINACGAQTLLNWYSC